MKLGIKKIRVKLKEKGRTYEWLLNEMDMHQVTFYNKCACKGKFKFSNAELFYIKHLLECELEELEG